MPQTNIFNIFKGGNMRYLLALFLVLALSASANAEFVGPGGGNTGSKMGGFHGPVSGAKADNVAAAKSLGDDAPVVLTGNLVSKVAGSKKKYVFKDGSGEIIVEISPKLFKGRDISPANTLRIFGKIDQDFGQEAEVDVKEFEVIK